MATYPLVHDLDPDRTAITDPLMTDLIAVWRTSIAYRMPLSEVFKRGTFSPILYGATTAGTYTYGTASGIHIVKPGEVTCHIWVTTTSETVAPVGTMRIGGLPFPARAGIRGGADIGLHDGMDPAGVLRARIQSGTDYLTLQKISTAGVSTGLDPSDINPAIVNFQATVTYMI